MPAFLGSVAAAIVVAIIAVFALQGTWRPAAEAYTTTSVRLTDSEAGHNLVGKDWYSSKEF